MSKSLEQCERIAREAAYNLPVCDYASTMAIQNVARLLQKAVEDERRAIHAAIDLPAPAGEGKFSQGWIAWREKALEIIRERGGQFP